MQELKSSNLAGYDYDRESGQLVIYFRGGRAYTYAGVEPETVAGLDAAASPGSFFHANIRDKYPYK